LSRSVALGKQAGKPHLVEGGVHPRCLAQHGGPQLLRFYRLASDCQATGLEQHLDERLQPFRSWMTDASLPLLDRASAGPQTHSQVALAQTRPAAVA
jgi:hypothetical protein